MDITSIERSDTHCVYLDHPATGEPLCRDDNGEQFWIEVYGTDSDHYIEVDRELQEKNLERIRRTGNIDHLNVNQGEAQALALLSKTVKAWNLQLGADYPEYTPELGKQVFSNPACRFIKEKVEVAQRNRANFFGS